jgi:hypothetical protein
MITKSTPKKSPAIKPSPQKSAVDLEIDKQRAAGEGMYPGKEVPEQIERHEVETPPTKPASKQPERPQDNAPRR